MDISVIVPFNNAERYLHKCIDALLRQTYPSDRYEVIMVDNNSTDSSADIVRRCSRVKLLSETRPGAYAARNLGVIHAKGDIVAFTDADRAPSSDWLERIALAMQCSGTVLIQGSVEFAHDSFGLSVLTAYEAEKAATVFSGDDREIYYGYTGNMAVRRCVLEIVGPFLEMARGSDVVFLQRVIDRYSCQAVRYVPEVRVRHLEIESVLSWYRKLFTYGRSFAKYRKVVPVRPLSIAERMRVCQRAIHHARLSLPRAAASMLLLSIGAACYELGRRLPESVRRSFSS
jgi:glycosyltransferase involved in cell wall biosynthesis